MTRYLCAIHAATLKAPRLTRCKSLRIVVNNISIVPTAIQ